MVFDNMRYLLLALLPLLAQAGEISTQRQDELIYLLHQDCGSCHGMTLKGGLGPSLLPEALQGKPVELLSATILFGRSGTPMPPWSFMLTESEATWLAQRLLNGEQPID